MQCQEKGQAMDQKTLLRIVNQTTSSPLQNTGVISGEQKGKELLLHVWHLSWYSCIYDKSDIYSVSLGKDVCICPI